MKNWRRCGGNTLSVDIVRQLPSTYKSGSNPDRPYNLFGELRHNSRGNGGYFETQLYNSILYYDPCDSRGDTPRL